MFPHHLSIKPFNIARQLLLDSIVGQDHLVDTVLLTLYRHLLKIAGVNTGYLKNSTSNLLIIGRTGTGKTFTVKEAAKILKLPFLEIDATQIAPGSSWKGKDLTDLIDEGFKSFEHLEARNYPIIFLDEFDKMCTKDELNHHQRVQAAILKIVDGIKIEIRHVKYDTRNFCFIFAGAFTDIFREESPRIGFIDNPAQEEEKIFTKDLEKFGVMPELAGRINKVIKANDFSVEMYYKMITNPNSAANYWLKYLKELGASSLDEFNIVALVDEAQKRNLGGRGMNQILEKEIDSMLLDNINKIDFYKAWDAQFSSFDNENKNSEEKS